MMKNIHAGFKNMLRFEQTSFTVEATTCIASVKNELCCNAFSNVLSMYTKKNPCCSLIEHGFNKNPFYNVCLAKYLYFKCYDQERNED